MYKYIHVKYVNNDQLSITKNMRKIVKSAIILLTLNIVLKAIEKCLKINEKLRNNLVFHFYIQRSVAQLPSTINLTTTIKNLLTTIYTKMNKQDTCDKRQYLRGRNCGHLQCNLSQLCLRHV